MRDSGTKTSATDGEKSAEDVLKSAAPQAVEVAAAATTQPLVPVIPQPQFAQKAAAPAPAQKRSIPAMPVVAAPKAARHGAVNPLSDTPLAEVVAKSGSTDIAHLHEKLLGLDRKLSTSVSTSIEEAGKLMSDLYRALVNVVERPSSEMEFAALWTFTMRVITETPLGGFTPQRLWRGKPQWPLSHEEFLHFESIWNLIDASVRHRGDYGRFVNEKKVMIGFSGAAQGRLGFFYRSFGG